MSLTPMKKYAIDIAENIGKAFVKPEAYAACYKDVVNNIIPSFNTQLKSYERNGKAAIRREILESIMSLVDFQALADRLRTDGKSRRQPKDATSLVAATNIPPLTHGIGRLSDDNFIDAYGELDDDKEFRKIRKTCLGDVTNILEKIDTFESQLMNYRTSVTSQLLTLQDLIYEHHYAYVLSVKAGNNKGVTYTLAGRQITISPSVKTQRDFFAETFKQLL